METDVRDEQEQEQANPDHDHTQVVPPPQRGSGPRLPQNIKRVTLPDAYGAAGFQAWIWVNCPSKLMDDALRSGAPTPPDFSDLEQRARALEQREQTEAIDPAEYDRIDEEQRERLREYREGAAEADKRRLAALNRIVTRHNDWCDENGDPYPPAGTDAFWEAIPNELAAALLVLVQREAAKLPNSMMRTGRR